jgi:NAD(P)-dependent dehydrogenase (short-subunit alcohol dehydrogenase family)
MSAPTAVVIGVGAERGLGAALCRRFAASGYHVLVAGRTPQKIERVTRTIAESGGSAEPVPTDTTLEADVIRLFDRAMVPGAGYDPADLIVFNAGNNQRIDFRELAAGQFEEFWRVGCFGGFLAGREAARRLAPLVEAQSSSPAPLPACAVSRVLRILRQPRRAFARSRRAWPGNTGRSAYMLHMW